MLMLRICVCYTYADGRHMDMQCLYTFLTFSAEIRKKVVPDLPEPHRRTAAETHKMRRSESCFLLYVVFHPALMTGGEAPDTGALLIP